jgi:predicted phosphohydrolase
MKIRLLSDLHTEFRLPYKTHPMSEYRGEDVLVLAGDIASGSTNTVDVIKHFLRCGFPNIVYVPGNHEYYGTDFDDFNQKMRSKCSELNGVHYLNGDSIVINGVKFVGATLWTNFGDNPLSEHAAKTGINDFRVIKGFGVSRCAQTYYDHVDYIKQAYETRDDMPVVVVTHFLPARECIAPRWRGANLLNDYFANDLGEYIAGMSNTTWMFGHTHDATDIQLGTTRVVANPHGYYNAMNDGVGFDPFKTITV